MNRKIVSGIMLILLLMIMLTLALDVQPVLAATDDYFWADGESLDIGFSKYGEMINPYKTMGLRYNDVNLFANPYVMESDWNEGWLMNITYEYEGALHNVWAYALYTDRSGSMGIDGAWREGCTEGPLWPPYGGRKTNGYASTDPMEVLHDDPDSCAVLLKTTIYDPEISNPDDPEDPKGLPLVDLVIRVVFNKMNKYVVLVSEVKLRSESTVLGKVHVIFGRRGEWDLEPYSWWPDSYAHFYHGLPYDLVQMIDDSESYVAYAAYWPELTSWRVEGISKLTRRAILTALSGWEQDDMTSEPDTPYTFGEWVFDLSYADGESSVHEFRCATVYGVNDLDDGDDSDMGYGHENVIDSGVVFEIPPPIPTTLGELKAAIEELGSEGEIDNHGIVKSLITKLNVTQKLVDKGKIDEARGILEEDFIPQVLNLTDTHITPDAAELLIESAEYILSNL